MRLKAFSGCGCGCGGAALAALFCRENDALAKITAPPWGVIDVIAVPAVAEMGALTAAASHSLQLGLRRKKLYVSDPSPSGSRRAPCFPLASALKFSRLFP
jgi:hypothetical protein